jgi:hypothetical protein
MSEGSGTTELLAEHCYSATWDGRIRPEWRSRPPQFNTQIAAFRMLAKLTHNR